MAEHTPDAFHEMTEPLSSRYLNPVWHEFVEEVFSQCAAPDRPSPMTLRRMAYELNDWLERCGWLGTEAEVSGKLRIEADDDDSDPPEAVERMVRQYPQGCDARGEYYEVAAERLVLDGVMIEMRQEGETVMMSDIRPIVTFYAPDDSEGYEITAHLSDISDIAFSNQPPENLERQLAYFWPEVYNRIDMAIPEGASLRGVIDALADLRIPAPLVSDEATRRAAEGWLSSWVDSGDDRYDIAAEGTIYSLDDQGELISTETDDYIRSVRLAGVALWEEHDAVVPYVMIEVPQGDYTDTVALYAMRPSNIVELYNLRISNPHHFRGQNIQQLSSGLDGATIADLFQGAKDQEEHRQLYDQLPDNYDDQLGAYCIASPTIKAMCRTFDADSSIEIEQLVASYSTELQQAPQSLRISRSMFMDEEGLLYEMEAGEHILGRLVGFSDATFEGGFRKLIVQLEQVTYLDTEGGSIGYFSGSTLSVVLEVDSRVAEVWYDAPGE